MSGGRRAVDNGDDFEQTVVAYARSVGLTVRRQVCCGKRIWGAQRFIDVLVCEKDGSNPLGIECKWQDTSGSAELKLFATLADIDSWKFPGLLIYEGRGFSRILRGYLHKHPLAICLAEFPDRLDTQYAVGLRPIRLYDENPDSHPELF